MIAAPYPPLATASTDGDPSRTRLQSDDAACAPSPAHPITHSPAHPSLPLLALALLNPDLSYDQIAAQHSITLDALLHLLQSEELQQHLATITAIEELRRKQKLARRTDRALDDLQRLAESTQDPVEHRRCATAIIRINSRSPRADAPLLRASPPDAEPPADPVTPHISHLHPVHPAFHTEQPRPSISPKQLILTALANLKDNNFPSPDHGLRALFNLCTENMRQDAATPDEFIARWRPRLAPILDFRRAAAAPLTRQDQAAMQVIILTMPNGARRIATFHLRYAFSAPAEFCWRLDNITLHDTS